jgi:glycosyltransferase involved in cell wall biosynthesis
MQIHKTSPNLLIAGMASWYLGHTAREFEKLNSLTGYWVSNSSRSGVTEKKYKRIWDYHLAQKLFYHLPFVTLEENMRWNNLPFYDRWIRRRKLPEGTNVVQGPMGSCEALFDLADRTDHRVMKVFDAPNSHPRTLYEYWQKECDVFSPGYTVPMSKSVRNRIERELDRADLVLCPSNFVRDTMVKNGVAESKCFISHFGVDTDIFKPRSTLPEVPTFVCVGILCLRKGQQYLFRAMEKVREQIPNAHLICVGGLRPNFEKELKRWKGTFEYHAHLSQLEIASLLSNSTAFVLPSVEEGFARVLSEAMACGLPIIATYETGATTVVTDYTEGIIVPSRDPVKLAEAMIKLGTDDEDNIRMGKLALQAGGVSNTWMDYALRLHKEYGKRLSCLA